MEGAVRNNQGRPKQVQAVDGVGFSRSGGPPMFEWPAWALDKTNPCIEVFVEREGEGLGLWVEAMPLKRVVDDAGHDARLYAQFVLDAVTHAQAFGPRHVRRRGGKLTAEERHHQVYHVDAAFDALHALYGFSDTQSECGSVVPAVPGGIDVSVCSLQEAEQMMKQQGRDRDPMDTWDPLGDTVHMIRPKAAEHQSGHGRTGAFGNTLATTGGSGVISDFQPGDIRIENVQLPTSDSAWMRCFQDLDRAMQGDSMFLAIHNRMYPIFPSDKATYQANKNSPAVGEAAFQALKNTIKDDLFAQTQESPNTSRNLHELSLRVAAHMAPSPGVTVAMRIGLPATLWQPIYVLCIGAGQVRVVTLAFVGEPLVCTRTDCKRWPFVLRLVTEDLMPHANQRQGEASIIVHYAAEQAKGTQSTKQSLIGYEGRLLSATATGAWSKLTRTGSDSKSYSNHMSRPTGADESSGRHRSGVEGAVQEDPSGYPVQMATPLADPLGTSEALHSDALADTVYMNRTFVAESKLGNQGSSVSASQGRSAVLKILGPL